MMEIQIGKGVCGIRFGQTEQEIVEVLGQPDKEYELEGSKRLQFFELQVEVALEHERDDRLDLIEVKNPAATLFGHALIGEELEKVLSLVSAVVSEAPEHDDYGGLETYFYEKNWLELQFELNRLRTINIGVLWVDNDTPLWP